jgi:hypothetical protein
MGAAERWSAGFRIRFEIFQLGARQWSNVRAEKQNALPLSHGFGDGSDIVHLA